MKRILLITLLMLSGCETLEVRYDVRNEQIAVRIVLDNAEW